MIIEGEARGADRLARMAAEAHGYTVERYPADWSAYHRAAGPIRNRQMLREGRPHLILAFHDHIAESKGTADMIEQAMRAHRRPLLINSSGRVFVSDTKFSLSDWTPVAVELGSEEWLRLLEVVRRG
jgi:hypothetical protein